MQTRFMTANVLLQMPAMLRFAGAGVQFAEQGVVDEYDGGLG